MAARAEHTQITADRVLKEYTRIAFDDLRKVSDWGPQGLTLKPPEAISDDDAAAIAWVSTGGRKGTRAQRIRLYDKQRALDALAWHLGLAKDSRATYDLRPYDPAAQRDLADGAREKLRRKLAAMAEPDGPAR